MALSTPLSTALGNGGLSTDTRSIDQLKSVATRDPKAAVKETAKQFETLFMQEVMKSMRQATMSSGMMDNSATQMGGEMLDQQYAGKMAGLPGGLSQAIERHLQRQLGVKDGELPSAKAAAGTQQLPQLATKNVQPHVQDFIQKHDGAAKSAQAATGIPASFMIAQAAHESGWGKREILNKDGSSSFNVFGIKAGPGWTGKVAEVSTTEYVDGKPQRVTAKFRAYGSYEEAFKDYAKLISGNDRYRDVVAKASTGSAEGFAKGLQKAGYATDPEYASKLARVINTTMRVQRAMA
ncbi:flagellar assembly peptidoglycan hydrolase FlgJ [Roseateles terrae]|uniref:Peptidoglycan hydrolase FlgJ n=1 Tax=Roseateles terrae TaxID=431060 RepID=A0ABR6GWU3_9BURK|nr:flagellar assembly peptidoglycan hydrolase FlgJ [Roseateles terrae]MBB3196566.1 flagellar protein FlgJ [Roseateles terrae]OWQ84829.1 flagellar assembly peptidoglycan hydrolase FlgJ [Roseateles terrae]